MFFSALRSQTAKEFVRIRKQTVVERAVLTNFALNSIPIQDEYGASKLRTNFVNQEHRNFDMDTNSELISFAQNLLSSIKMSEIDLSENKNRKRTDPQLLKQIPGRDLSFVLSSWGKRHWINWKEGVLNDYEDLFMKS